MNELSDCRRYIFLSIHQQYAELILEGRKTVELRRRKPKVGTGDIVILYATSPLCSVLGSAEIQEVMEESPNTVWNSCGNESMLSKEHFDTYFEAANTAIAIYLKSHHRLDKPIPLARLKLLLSDFSPPQSYRYISQADAHKLGIG